MDHDLLTIAKMQLAKDSDTFRKYPVEVKAYFLYFDDSPTRPLHRENKSSPCDILLSLWLFSSEMLKPLRCRTKSTFTENCPLQPVS